MRNFIVLAALAVSMATAVAQEKDPGYVSISNAQDPSGTRYRCPNNHVKLIDWNGGRAFVITDSDTLQWCELEAKAKP